MSDDNKIKAFSPLRTVLWFGQWFGTQDKNGFMYPSRMKNLGIPEHQGKPIIGICNTWFKLPPCSNYFRELAESLRCSIVDGGCV